MNEDEVKKTNDIGTISILMAAFNAEKTINMAIDSVLAQTYSKWELIIINDCSTDNTLSIVQEYSEKDKRIIVINNDVNKGVSVSRKEGLEKASGEWIAILDSDDAWEKIKLNKQVLRQKETNGDIIYTGSAFMDSNGKKMNWIFEVPSRIEYKKLLMQNVISNSSTIVRKSLFERYYSKGDNMHEDYANWLRILKDGYTAYGINEPLLIYRIQKNSKTGNKLQSATMNWNTYRYVGLNVIQSAWYMAAYTINGIKKYSKLLKNEKRD